jgi:hypothetical protein
MGMQKHKKDDKLRERGVVGSHKCKALDSERWDREGKADKRLMHLV